jgi:hypothetical protein
MLATPDARKVAFAVAVFISMLVALVAPKGKRGLAFIGCGVGLIGVIGILNGIIPQRWAGGPPLEGSLATFGSLIMLGIGLLHYLPCIFPEVRPSQPKEMPQSTLLATKLLPVDSGERVGNEKSRHL